MDVAPFFTLKRTEIDADSTKGFLQWSRGQNTHSQLEIRETGDSNQNHPRQKKKAGSAKRSKHEIMICWGSRVKIDGLPAVQK